MKTFKDMQETRQLEPNDNDTGDTWMFTYFNSYYIGIPSGGEFHLTMPNEEYFSHSLDYLEYLLWRGCVNAEMNSLSNADVVKLLEKNLEINASRLTQQELRRLAKLIRAGHGKFTADEMINLKRWIG